MIKRPRCAKSGQSGGNGAAHSTQFGIIWNAALYARYAHATVKLFTNLWDEKQKFVLQGAISTCPIMRPTSSCWFKHALSCERA
jgi:hypothetical protein